MIRLESIWDYLKRLNADANTEEDKQVSFSQFFLTGSVVYREEIQQLQTNLEFLNSRVLSQTQLSPNYHQGISHIEKISSYRCKTIVEVDLIFERRYLYVILNIIHTRLSCTPDVLSFVKSICHIFYNVETYN